MKIIEGVTLWQYLLRFYRTNDTGNEEVRRNPICRKVTLVYGGIFEL